MGTVAINLLWVSHLDHTGAFVEVKNLLDQFVILETKTKFLLIVRWHDRQFFRARYGDKPNVSLWVSDPRLDLGRQPLLAVKKIIAKLLNNEVWLESLIAQELNRRLRQNGVRKMLCPTQTIYPRGLKNIDQYVIILDLQHEYFPQNFSAAEIARRRAGLDYVAKTARHLFAISHYTKATLIEKLKLVPNRITVAPLAPNQFPVTTKALNVARPFLFYPAALWPHKNHRLLIETLKQLAPDYSNLNLVFSGAIKKPRLKSELETLIADYGLTGRVHFLGFVTNEEVAWLYSQATALVFPSSFEGFGMPILEAYCYHLPVVATRGTSITEVAGDAALLCAENQVAEFVAAIKQLLSQPNLKATLKPKMDRQLNQFSWAKTATIVLNRLNADH